MPPIPAPPAPRTSPVIADDSLLVLAIGMQCLILVGDQYLQSECKTSGTQETAHAHEALVGRVGEQESGKEDKEDAKGRWVDEGPEFGFYGMRAEALDGEALGCGCCLR